MRFFGLKACDTCRKALKSLAAVDLAPEVIDVRADGVAPQDLATIVDVFGDTAINRASTTWRGLSDAEKTGDPITLLATYPTLMKRPVIEVDGSWTIGWKPDVQSKYLGD